MMLTTTRGGGERKNVLVLTPLSRSAKQWGARCDTARSKIEGNIVSARLPTSPLRARSKKKRRKTLLTPRCAESRLMAAPLIRSLHVELAVTKMCVKSLESFGKV